jgi:chromate transport protein ChrA
MFGLAVGVSHIQQQLPDVVYALLSGLNASTVGIIALAAIQLSQNSIKDQVSRMLVIFGGCAGLCYTALWYFPVIMIVGGLVAAIWDTWMGQMVIDTFDKFKKGKSDSQSLVEENVVSKAPRMIKDGEGNSPAPRISTEQDINMLHPVGNPAEKTDEKKEPDKEQDSKTKITPKTAGDAFQHAISVKIGILVIVLFFLSFIALMIVRSLVHTQTRALSLFANMYLAGTIIFGGGPVVIPLLREYVVQPGWVTSRDFLIGLAIIQAAPGPNFNFGVYLGALAVRGTRWPMILGAFLGYVGIFLPGVTLAVGVQALWRALRSRSYVVAALRGVNASAVGLVFTAVYRLWQIGYLSKQYTSGQSLALNPWWLVVSALAYSMTAWFKVPPAGAIISGAIFGLCWYGAVGRFEV